MEASCELDTALVCISASLYPAVSRARLETVINLQQDKYRVDTATAGQGPVLQQAE